VSFQSYAFIFGLGAIYPHRTALSNRAAADSLFSTSRCESVYSIYEAPVHYYPFCEVASFDFVIQYGYVT
jgi:hypothetical protein